VDVAERAEQWDITESVGLTALGVAAGRSIETHRPGALIDDPLAERFVRAAELREPFPLRVEDIAEDAFEVWNGRSRYVGVRTRFIDDYVDAASRGGIRQFVLLAAGLDARPYRLEPHGDPAWFEVDQPKVLAFKQEVTDAVGARPHGSRHTVPVDLREDWPAALLAAGFDAERPTAWVAEGLLAYLPARAEADLFGHVTRLSAPGSRICADLPDSHTMASAENDSRLLADEKLGIDMRRLLNFEPRTDCVDRLRSAGWEVSVDGVGDVAGRYGVTFEGEIARRVETGRFATARI
jgi:methyltransferase (TIGR00027 family)